MPTKKIDKTITAEEGREHLQALKEAMQPSDTL